MHNWQYENYLCSTDKSKLQLEMIHDFLCNQSYWAKGRTIEQVIKSINHSECFGIYREEQQLGFARVISDFTVYAYLLDVFIVEQKRGSGLGKFLMECIMSHPGLKVKRWIRRRTWLISAIRIHLTKEDSKSYGKSKLTNFAHPNPIFTINMNKKH